MKTASYSCAKVAKATSAYLDGLLPPSERHEFEAHRSACDRCRQQVREARELASSLRALPVRNAPAYLTTRLRITASREAIRRRRNATWRGRIDAFREDVQLVFDNLMRPLAIPTAGGFLSALLLFAMLAPGLARNVHLSNDVPTGLYTGASVKSGLNVGFSNQDVIVEFTIDEAGRAISYDIPTGQPLGNNPSIRRAIENNLLFTVFEPARTFGQPMGGKIRVSLRASTIDVKG